jgi:pilus assembly protein CpaD
MTFLNSKTARGARIVVATSLATLALAGCRHLEDPGTRVAAWQLVDAKQRHPIMVSKQPREMTLRVSPGARGLSTRQRAKLVSYYSQFRATDTGNGRLVIRAPSGSANEVAGMHVVREARDLLRAEGLGEADIIVEAYHADGGHPPVKLSFLTYVAEGPTCRNFPTNLAYQPNNLPYPDLGCSTQRNLAGMIANASDLVEPRTMTSRSSERRDETWNKYLKGETTGAKKSQDERIEVKGK